MQKNDSEVPVVLFVFDRYEPVRKTLSCLRKNKIPRLIVFADGPRNDEDKKKIQKVHKLINSITWTTVEKTYHNRNIGITQSVRGGLDVVFRNYDKAIILEDDIAVSPNFYNFMKQSLDLYQTDKGVAAVTGLRMPFNRKVFQKYPYDGYFTPRFSSWGWGTWRRAWKSFNFDRLNLKHQVREKNINLGLTGIDHASYFPGALNGTLTETWDALVAISILVNEQLILSPTQGLVENTGLLQGTHFNNQQAPVWAPRWEKYQKYSDKSLRLPTDIQTNKEIFEATLRFYEKYFAPSEPSNLFQKIINRVRKLIT